jgi:phosphoglycerate dehydrogenase-like enzyme
MSVEFIGLIVASWPARRPGLLADLTVGIVGLGEVGSSRVAYLLQPFDTTVLAVRRPPPVTCPAFGCCRRSRTYCPSW